jgi:pimeloyl-ACP methyl ester carboxylesterase
VSAADVEQHAVGGRPVRSLAEGRAQPGVPELVLVPGLGALGYLRPTVDVCAATTRVHLLDLPGFGSRSTARCPASLGDVARAAAGWLQQVPERPVLLVGHSTGAQAALRAALLRPEKVAALVLSGVTFPPAARRVLPLLARTARTLVHEQPGELAAVLPEYLRGRGRLLQLLRTALADRPEDAVGGLPVPPLVVRGRQDRLCDQAWAERLAAAGGGRVVVVPGAHNSVTTHPLETAAAWLAAVAQPVNDGHAVCQPGTPAGAPRRRAGPGR